ncbi:MAG: PDZ domain-containing protein [Gemmatimonadota bacterium]|jgi:membrane-associated protease RseP (regulator of RpoE activity)
MRGLARFPVLAATVGLSALSGLAATPAAAQEARPTKETADRGWIGVSFELRTVQSDTGLQTSATLTDVMEGSPAARAGLRAGDVVISINGHSWRDDRYAGVPQNLRVGDPVRMVVERDGRRQEFQVVAAPRPRGTVIGPTVTLTLGADSMADRMYRAMDSLRVRLIQEGPSGFSLRSFPAPGDSILVTLRSSGARDRRVQLVDEHGGTITVQPFSPEDLPEGFFVPEVRPPFGFYVFRGEAHDSLLQAMNALNREIQRLRAEHAARTRELARRDPTEPTDMADAELVRLTAELRDASQRASDLRDAMERASRRDAQRLAQSWTQRTDDPANTGDQTSHFRPLAPYVLGQNRAAGAEVVDLKPELAEYFDVDGGVLVVDVPDGTPAALAGIQPGDVITHVGSRAVSSIPELRAGLATSAAETGVTVVRKGKTLQVLLRR